jgi:hypothetical protein
MSGEEMTISRILPIALLLVCASAWALNVDLSTVPRRSSVQLTIYNSEDLTLVRETRTVTFRKGLNPLQFSWASTLIDPTSVELRFPGREDRLRVLAATFPHDKPQMLYWSVQSDADQEAVIEISYFTSGISWQAEYLAVARSDESRMRLEGYVRVTNHSGEEYRDAQVRLVVGTIHLVERIAELARRPVQELGKREYDRLRVQAARQMMMRAEVAMPAPAAKTAGALGSMAPKEVKKEGISEYFIYTIEGTETVPDGWAKRLRSFAAAAVPIRVVYRYRPAEYGDRLVRLYLFTNDAASGLGTTPLPEGQMQVLREDGRGGLRYLTRYALKYAPIGDKVEVNLGEDPEVMFQLKTLRVRRDEIWMRYSRANLYRKVGQDSVHIELDSKVAGYDEHRVYDQRVHNLTPRPIDVEIRRSYDGDVTFVSGLDPRLHDYRTVEYQRTLQPGERADLLYEVITRTGYNSRQQRVELRTGRVVR